MVSIVKRLLLVLGGLLLAFWLGGVALYRFVDPPLTPLMLLRLGDAPRLDHRFVPFDRVAPSLAAAVVAAEDNRFCVHNGIDWTAVGEAIEEYQENGRLRGASTITMQTARNLFLWPGGSFPRKAVETALAYIIDATWPKWRILEVYLNVAEWGDGLYGAEAAAQTRFGKPASRLTRREAALLAAVLPSPRRWRPDRPSDYVRRRALRIERRMAKLGALLDCVDGPR